MSDKDVKDFVRSSTPAASFDYGVAESKETHDTTRTARYVPVKCFPSSFHPDGQLY
jgi:hypothetical protein